MMLHVIRAVDTFERSYSQKNDSAIKTNRILDLDKYAFGIMVILCGTSR